uniref:VWFA domain-containing protein n=1 Tax=Zonotrichia albicollis TaxID=44394 RepID=A0A8D2QEL7_ZONAL
SPCSGCFQWRCPALAKCFPEKHVLLLLCLAPECTCGPVDLLFVLDSSESIGLQNFQIAKDFIIKVIDRLSKDERVKVTFPLSAVKSLCTLTYFSLQAGKWGGAPTPKSLHQYNYTVIAKAIDNMEFMNDATDVNSALQFITEMYRRSARAAAKKRVLVFSDGHSQGITARAIERAVQDAQKADIEIYVLAVGSQANEPNIRVLVTGKSADYDVVYGERHLFRVPDYTSLLRGVFYQTVSRKIAVD